MLDPLQLLRAWSMDTPRTIFPDRLVGALEPGYEASFLVLGADPIENRPAFGEMLERIASNGVKTIIVETANRFARDLIVQETGYRMLRDAGISLIAADSPDTFIDVLAL